MLSILLRGARVTLLFAAGVATIRMVLALPLSLAGVSYPRTVGWLIEKPFGRFVCDGNRQHPLDHCPVGPLVCIFGRRVVGSNPGVASCSKNSRGMGGQIGGFIRVVPKLPHVGAVSGARHFLRCFVVQSAGGWHPKIQRTKMGD